MAPTRKQLHATAEALCNDFANGASLEKLFSHFSTTHQISYKEHGLPLLAPFLGCKYTGRQGLEEYFGIVSKHLAIERMSFAEWIVDDEARKVSVRAEGRFKWIEGAGVGQWWEEEFVYIIDLDDEAKITDIQVFADTGAAYLARIGELNALREASEKRET